MQAWASISGSEGTLRCEKENHSFFPKQKPLRKREYKANVTRSNYLPTLSGSLLIGSVSIHQATFLHLHENFLPGRECADQLYFLPLGRSISNYELMN